MSGLLTILAGDCREVLKTLPDASVQCCVTSPPYWGLRDYGHAKQIGQEPTPELYVESLRAVFAEVRRVLRDDGTLWLNLGDSYAAQRGGTAMPAETLAGGVNGKGDADAHRGRRSTKELGGRQDESSPEIRTYAVTHRNARAFGLKHKDLIGIPWMVAFALRADGWWLRQDIIWHKPSCMPESVTDRCTKAHEYIFLMSKSANYHYDHEAIKERSAFPDDDRKGRSYDHHKSAPTEERNGMRPKSWRGSEFHDGKNAQVHPNVGKNRGMNYLDEGRGAYEMRNKRSVWSVTNAGYRDAHFATFPPNLILPCILAGTKPGDVVLDPFGGSGTTGMVALKQGRRTVIIELNPDYVQLAERRCDVTPGFQL